LQIAAQVARHVEVADVVRHEAGARLKMRDVAAALLHQAQLVGLDGLAQLVVADLQLGRLRGMAAGSWMPAIWRLRQRLQPWPWAHAVV
jgi:hypothetical protein